KEPDMVRKSIGFLTGQTKLYDRLTTRETLFYFGRLYNIPEEEIKGRIEEIAFMLELNDALNSRVSTLSDGMKQKVSIGRAIIHNPRALVLDEPLTGLDILARRSVTEFIKYSKEQGKSVLFSTHVMSEAEEMCDRVAIIYKGKILNIGKKEELKEKYGKTTLEEIFIELMRREDEESWSDS
ncbi:MAG: ATP-binding cassette domain-containing protein, partial [candidate division WOR-3 bacterium]|nr:ATP-binding cassette domain-containing protein [candidate division WOR-3 bacterium]